MFIDFYIQLWEYTHFTDEEREAWPLAGKLSYQATSHSLALAGHSACRALCVITSHLGMSRQW